MEQPRKVIAICGALLYEEKEFSFILRLKRACQERGYVVVAFSLSTDPLKNDSEVVNERPLTELIRSFPLSALIILAETIKVPPMREYVKEAAAGLDIPVFALDRHIDGCINIASNFGDGFKNMVRHVIRDHGCKKINMIAGAKDNDFSEERIQAYKEALAENNIPFDEKRLAYGDFWDRPAREATKAFIDSGDIPEAIVCANDTMAIAACSVLQENGYKVPEDVIVTGYDGIMSARLNLPPISTVAPNYEEEVKVIFDLIDSIEAGNLPDTSATRYVDFMLRKNRSCGCGDSDERITTELINKLSYAFNDQKWQVAAMNTMLLSAADKQHLQELAPLLGKAIEMWQSDFYFVGMHSELLNSEDIIPKYGRGYTTLFRSEHGTIQKNGEQYDSSIAIPDFSRLLLEENGYSLFMVRLLFTDTNIYGYLVEGFNDIDVRSMRRCDEFGLFISTAISEILKNEKLFWFNERLKQLNKEMERAAIHDPLTGLYNRRGFFDELARISKASAGRYITFFSIDMDGLKNINDHYGHNEGDLAISSIADAIRHFSARNGICARFGGDEFVCALITDDPLHLSPDTVRNRLEMVLSGRSDLRGKPYSVTASVGYESVKIDSVLDIDSIMRKADAMMYEDKHKRKMERQG
ncbi:MAG: GGDEF domain-containing protein [Lachnospiraceae bacterium]|nr:GGDEF domain-containing protein [Lachnospiraceae bacterium]